VQTKRCPHCGDTKTADEYYRRKTGALSAYCKACQRKLNALHSAKRGPEYTKTYNRAYYDKNREKLKADVKQRYETHRQSDECRVCPSCGYSGPARDFPKPDLCRTCHNAYGRQWAKANRKRANEYHYRWCRKNPGYNQAIMSARWAAQAGAPYIHPDTVLELWDGICGLCGEEIAFDVAFVIDHYLPINPSGHWKPGPHALWNLRPAHEACNIRKSNRMPWEWEEYLDSLP
jgi:5-methylcytosine-specific restriction endonuclease McrA